MPLYGNLYAEERFTKPQSKTVKTSRTVQRLLKQKAPPPRPSSFEVAPKSNAWRSISTGMIYELIRFVGKKGLRIDAFIGDPKPANLVEADQLFYEGYLQELAFNRKKLLVSTELGNFLLPKGFKPPKKNDVIPFIGKEYIYDEVNKQMWTMNPEVTRTISNKLMEIQPEGQTSEFQIKLDRGFLEIIEIPLPPPMITETKMDPLPQTQTQTTVKEINIVDLFLPDLKRPTDIKMEIRAQLKGTIRVKMSTDRTQQRFQRIRRRKDRKTTLRKFYAPFLRFLNQTIGSYDEAMQIGRAYYDNLYWTSGQFKGQSISKTNQLSWSLLHSINLTSYNNAFKLHMSGKLELDVVGFGLDLAANHIQDMAIGQVASMANQAMFSSGYEGTTGVQFGKALDGGNPFAKRPKGALPTYKMPKSLEQPVKKYIRWSNKNSRKVAKTVNRVRKKVML